MEHISDVLPDGQRLVAVRPDDPITTALTHMMAGAGGLSQLPIIDDKGVLHGGSPGSRLPAGRYPEVVSLNADLVHQIPKIIKHGFVLVRGARDKVDGIVTTADLAERPTELAGVYVQLREIELRP